MRSPSTLRELISFLLCPETMSPCHALRRESHAIQAGDMWGQYLAAQRKKEDAQHASAAKQMHAGRNMQSRPPVSRAEPRIHDHRTVSFFPQSIIYPSCYSHVQSLLVTCPVCRLAPRTQRGLNMQVVPGTDKQRPLGTARGFSAKSSSPVGRKSHTARPFKPGGLPSSRSKLMPGCLADPADCTSLR